MKKYLILVLVCLMLVLVGCSNNNSAIEFKKDYESVNGTTNKNGKEHRSVTISDENPYEKVEAKDILDKIENKETFYVYFGDKLCPWCRSVIEKMIEIVNEEGVKHIYYVDVRPGKDSYDTDIRDEYAVDENGNIYLQRIGSDSFHEFLKRFDLVLKPYSRGDIKSLDGTEFEGQKRLGAPNIIYVEKGIPKRLVSGISEKQTDAYIELTDEILKDEEKILKEFFK